MGRTKDFENHINLITEEITKTKAKLERLTGELETLTEQREKHEMGALYKYIRDNKIQMSDVLHTISKEIKVPEIEDITTVKNSSNSVKKQNKTKRPYNRKKNGSSQTKKREKAEN